MLIPGDIPDALSRFKVIEPSPEPVLTSTVQLVPEPLTVPILAPVTPDVVNEKLLAVTPVTLDPNVTLYVTEVALVEAALGVPLFIELTVVLLDVVNVKLLLALIQPVVLFLTVAIKSYVLAALAGMVTLIGDAGKEALLTALKLGIAEVPVVIEY